MKIKLNLLPKSRERKIKNRKILKFVILQEIMIIVITFLFFGVIKGINAVASFQLEGVNQEISQNDKRDDYVEIKKYEDGLRDVKNKVELIARIQKFDINWVILLEKLSAMLPSEVVIKSIDGNGYKLILKGVAKNRDALIKSKDEMQKDGCFKDVDVPLNNIVLRENIEFELKFEIDEKCLNKYEKK